MFIIILLFIEFVFVARECSLLKFWLLSSIMIDEQSEKFWRRYSLPCLPTYVGSNKKKEKKRKMVGAIVTFFSIYFFFNSFHFKISV